MQFKKLKFYFFLFAITVWAGVFFILPDFLIYPTIGFKGTIYRYLHFLLVCIPLFFTLYLLAINKYIFKVLFPAFILLGSLIGYYSFRYKAIFTPMILDATLHNDIRTSLDVVTLELLIFILIQFFLAFFIIKYRNKITIKKTFLHLILASLSLIILFSINGRVTNTFKQHFPGSLYYNFTEYWLLNKEKNTSRLNPDISLRDNCNDSTFIVFVLGESLRADHLSLNGYERKTTPNLDKRENLITLSNIYSEYTYTNPSVAHILTRADEQHYERAKTEKSFISLFNQANYHTVWLANQEASEYYYSFMKECDTIIYSHPEKSVYTYSKWLDEDLLPSFNETIKKPKSCCQLVILHTIGSHWFYNSHFSDEFAQFKPLANSKVVTQNTKQEMINSYDNTILYMDYFVDNLIKAIENKNSILIFLSDHGESLGENGSWLHASSNNKFLHLPASFIWFSKKYLSTHQEAYNNLVENKDKRYRTDFLYHTILSAGNIPTTIINKNLNLFSNKQKLSISKD